MGPIYPGISVAFRKIFGDEKNRDLLISFLNSVFEYGKIRDVTVNEMCKPPSCKSSWRGIPFLLLIHATGCDDREFNIAINIDPIEQFYSPLFNHPIIHIHNVITPELTNRRPHAFYRLAEPRLIFKRNNYYDRLELHVIDLNSFAGFNKQLNSDTLMNNVESTLDMWMAFLTRPHLIELDKLPKKVVSIMKKALDVWKNLEFSSDEQELYQLDYECIKNRYKDLRAKLKDTIINTIQDGMDGNTISDLETFDISQSEIDMLMKKSTRKSSEL